MLSKTVSSGRIRICLALLLAGAASLYLSLSSCGTEKGPPPVGGGGGGGGGGADPAGNVLTYHNDLARTGQMNETVLTPANVNSGNFGRIGFLSTGGMVDAQPLVVGNLNGTGRNVVFVASEDDVVIAFDADNFSQLWRTSALRPGEAPSDDRGCPDVTPQIGITSTPVIDPNAGPNGTIFLVAMSKDGRGNYHHRLHALDLSTGAERPGSPVEIQASFPGTADFDPAQYKERTGLLLQDGVIYLGWAPHCDTDPYTSWFMGYNESSLQQVSVLNLTPNGSEGGIWMSGGAPSVDSSGFIYLSNGNGTFDTTLDGSGFPINHDLGNVILKLSASGGSLRVVDYFTPHNTLDLTNADLDFGSGGILLLPDQRDGAGRIVHLAVTGGKDGNVYVVNRDSMGKFNPNNNDALYQEIDAVSVGGIFGTPAYFNGTVYICGRFTAVQAFPIANGKLATTPSSSSATLYDTPGCVPSISANGGSNAIVWTVERTGSVGDTPGSVGVLHAYDANNLANELYNSNQAGGRDSFTAHAFTTPTITNGKVYVGTRTGVIVFGTLH